MSFRHIDKSFNRDVLQRDKNAKKKLKQSCEWKNK